MLVYSLRERRHLEKTNGYLGKAGQWWQLLGEKERIHFSLIRVLEVDSAVPFCLKFLSHIQNPFRWMNDTADHILYYMWPQLTAGSLKGSLPAGGRTRFTKQGKKVAWERYGENIPASFLVTANKPYCALCLKARETVEEHGPKLNRRFVLWMDSCFCRKSKFQKSPCRTTLDNCKAIASWFPCTL